MSGLRELGWKEFFDRQIDKLGEGLEIARIVAVQRTGLVVAPALEGFEELPLAGRWFNLPQAERPVVGDWVIVERESGSVAHVLERFSLIQRLTGKGEIQSLAANVDTAFIVTSANNEFNLARIERYLAAMAVASVEPVVVLTKVDLVEDAQGYLDEVRGLGESVQVIAVNSKDATSLAALAPWQGAGESIALLGSSGVGKSTLVNTLCGNQIQSTQASRAKDDKGRHTTTFRSFHQLPGGGVILDSPGIREFQIVPTGESIEAAFPDVEALAELCRFGDCTHGPEPGCAVQAAISSEELDERRFQSYLKLKQELAGDSAKGRG